MTKQLRVLVLCAALIAAACLPVFAQKTCQGEAIPGDTEWLLMKNYGTSGVISDQYAFGGQALEISKPLGSLADDVFIYRHQSAATFYNVPAGTAGTATAVVRVKTTANQAFDSGWPRTFCVVFRSGSGTYNNRAIGISIKPTEAAIVNSNSTTVYGPTIAGDNTHYVTWTIVCRMLSLGGNAGCDVYRNGVPVAIGITGINSSPESRSYSGSSDHTDGVWLGCSNQSRSGAWAFDAVAYKPGEDPTWNPFPGTGQITGVVSKAGDPNTRIANAIVTLSNGTQTTTDGGGVYSFSGVGPNDYTVSVSAPGYFSRSYSGISLPYSASSPVIQNMELIPLPAETQVVYDNFERSPWEDLGTTEDPMAYPWDLTDEAGMASVAYQLFLQPLYAHGVSIGGGFLPANIDYSIDIGPLGSTTDPSAEWGGISYRQSMPNVYDSIGGQDPNQAGYLVWCPVGGAGIYLWRNGVVGYSPIHIDWSTAHRIRVIAYGDHHEILVDGLKVIDVMNNAKLSGGYVGVMRHNANLTADNLYISVLQDGSGLGTISGTIVDAANPSTPIAGAFVSHSDGRSATSDSNGAYSFSLNSFDQQRITVRAAGYLDKTVVITPSQGVNTVDFQMQIDPSYRGAIEEAKAAGVGATVSLVDKVIAAQWSGTTAYIEEPGRNSGIKVILPGVDTSLYTKMNKVVRVHGTLQEDSATGELYVEADNWYEPPVAKVFLKPMAMSGRTVLDKSAGVDIVGLAAKVAGKVTAVNNPTDLTIDDGSGPLKVVIDPAVGLGYWPAVGDFVEVEGIVSLDGTSPETAVRCLRPWHSNSNILEYNAGFERPNPMEIWGYDDYTGGLCPLTWDTTNPHSGTTCAQFSNSYGFAPGVYGHFYRYTPGAIWEEEYEISCWVRGEGLVTTPGSTHITDWVPGGMTFNLPGGSFPWTKIGTKFRYIGASSGGFTNTHFIQNLNIVNTCTTVAVDDWYLGFARGTVRPINPAPF